MGLKVVLIEDEPSIARHIQRILTELEREISVIEHLTNVEDAILWLRRNMARCDLIFSDIRLSDGLSFEIFKKVPLIKPIIFITAYEEYALEAFNTNGIHYVVKPFEKKDINAAIEKFDLLITGNKNLSYENKMLSLIELLEAKRPVSYKKAYLVKFRDRLIPVPVKDIAWFTTKNDVVYAQTFENKTYIIESTLERVYAEISPEDFYRASRQFIVNRSSITDMNFYFQGRLIINVLPASEERILVSKAKVNSFKKWLNL